MAVKKQIVIKWLLATLWILIGSGTIVLLVAAIQKKDAEQCKGVFINIEGADNNPFVDKSDILNSIKTILKGRPEGKPIKGFDLKKMETELDKNIWVKSAELFFDNNEILRVNVVEREPIARVFTTMGTTFYIDSSVKILPLSDKFSAKLPVFTNFPCNENKLSKEDSSLLKDVRAVSMAILKDTFSMAMIDQVDITSQRTFEMMPKLGDQVIMFGDANDADVKLKKMQLFYKEVIMKAGWNYYSTINIQYKGQVVARRKGTGEVIADSLETMRLMKVIAANAEKMSGDSLFQMIARENALNADTATIALSFEREDEGYDIPTSIEKPKPQETVVVKPGTTTVKPVAAKPATNEPAKKPTTVTKPAPAKPAPAKPTVKSPAPAKPATTPKPMAKPAAKAPEKAPAKPAATTTKPATNVKPKPSKANNDY